MSISLARGEEEWVLVVAGTPSVRTPAGERVLAPWDVAINRPDANLDYWEGEEH